MNVTYERSYPTPFANSSLLTLLLLSLNQQKHSPKTSSTFKREYDFIIVGAGAAGSVVASRLSEIPCVSVLLLEAGKSPPLLTEVPATDRSYWFTDIDWQYKTVPQRHSGYGLINNEIIWPSGKAIGGSSILNGMLYVRGNRQNYDDWAMNGSVGWSASDTKPYFLKLEDNRESEFLANGHHVVDGPISVETPEYHPEIQRPILEAGEEMGYKIVDSNGYKQTGFYAFQATLRNGQRCSAAKGYLVPAENRTNLDILSNAFVRKVLIQRREAKGVIFDYKGRRYAVRARKEVIMSAGTINTAQLLMLSGIGPSTHLREFSIPVVADLPVGENLQDHCATPLNFELDLQIRTIEQKLTDPMNIVKYIHNRTGPLVTISCSVNAFLNDNPDSKVDFPNYQIYLGEVPTASPLKMFGLKPEVYQNVYGPYRNATMYMCFSQILNPKSRGTVRLRSSNPVDPPLIDPNYFADRRDLEDAVQGLKTCKRIGSSGPMQKVGSKPFTTLQPNCEIYSSNEQLYLECLARSVLVSVSHEVGTAKMGHPEDPTTVVDPELRVKGIKGLRVVDASVMPIIPSGNTYIPTLMVAEKASDMIKATLMCNKQIPVISQNEFTSSPYYQKPPHSPNVIH